MDWKLYIFDMTNWVFWKSFESKDSDIEHATKIHKGENFTDMYPSARTDMFRIECPGIGTTELGF